MKKSIFVRGMCAWCIWAVAAGVGLSAWAENPPGGSQRAPYSIQSYQWYWDQPETVRAALDTMEKVVRQQGGLGLHPGAGGGLQVVLAQDAEMQQIAGKIRTALNQRSQLDTSWAQTILSIAPQGVDYIPVPKPVGSAGVTPEVAARTKAEKLLEKHTRDLTREAAEGKLDPVIGRDAEIGRVLQILSLKKKNNAVLVGDAGVGKTAIAEGVAQWLHRGERVPEQLRGRRVRELSMGDLVAGTKFRGEFEERVKQVVEALQETKDIVFIDELHTMVGAGNAEGGLDAANILKPALARGELTTIAATTLDEYRKHIEGDAALDRRFTKLDVEEPPTEVVGQIVARLQNRYEQHHGVQYTSGAIREIVKLGTSRRFWPGRSAPDTAIDLLDESGSLVANPLDKMVGRGAAESATPPAALDERGPVQQRQRTPQVTAEDVRKIVEQKTGIPVASREQLAKQAMKLPEVLEQEVFGQPEAIEAVARVNDRYVADLKPDDRPIGTFLFFGGTGTGKTYLPERVAAHVLGDKDAVIRIDMNEYREKHSVARLFGSPPGYVGYEEEGQLTGKVRRRPYSVIVFDEIEKAHPEVLSALLQVLEKGEMTDGKGRRVDFKDTFIFMTSNVGQAELARARKGKIGFKLPHDQEQSEPITAKLDLTDHFLPEFVNRVDEVVAFRDVDGQLGPKLELGARVDHDRPAPKAPSLRRKLNEEIRYWKDRVEKTHGATFEVTEAARDHLLREGHAEAARFGMRPLLRAVSRRMLTPLSHEINAGNVRYGGHYVIDAVEPGRSGRLEVREVRREK